MAPSASLPPFRSIVEPAARIGQTILLVEDNEDNRIIYTTVLRHVGYDVIEAQDGVQAIALARSAHPDLILMDISIPEIDGWEATRILLEGADTRSIPIIALTAHALQDDREKAVKLGFTSYLAKPVEPRAVVAEVQRWIGGGAQAAE
jgi:CheY-like chemotaxis protein